MGEHHCLIVLGLHGIVPDATYLRSGAIDPSFVLAMDQIEAIINYFLEDGFIPVGVEQVLAGLDPMKYHFMLTFDDGYYNNLLMLPLLERLNVPAQFALIGHAVRTGHAFWWDVLNRTGPIDPDNPLESRDSLSLTPLPEIEAKVVQRFGEHSLRPAGDIDRPMKTDEIRRIANHPLITIANHSWGHRILQGMSERDIEADLTRTQEELQNITGFAPQTVVYPYGLQDPAVLSVSRRMGFKLGFAGNHAKIGLPLRLNSDLAMRLPRFSIFNTRSIVAQCESCHLEWKPSWFVRRMLHQGMVGPKVVYS